MAVMSVVPLTLQFYQAKPIQFSKEREKNETRFSIKSISTQFSCVKNGVSIKIVLPNEIKLSNSKATLFLFSIHRLEYYGTTSVWKRTAF